MWSALYFVKLFWRGRGFKELAAKLVRDYFICAAVYEKLGAFDAGNLLPGIHLCVQKEARIERQKRLSHIRGRCEARLHDQTGYLDFACEVYGDDSAERFAEDDYLL